MSKYIVGNSNQMAHAAAVGVVDNPGETYNPLFLYGPSGVGKTHLSQAIGIGIIERNPNRKVVYAAAEGFLNDLVKAIKRGQTLEFRNKYRQIDCLIIDDVQFISGWEKSQDEFFNTFNELYNANKQIVLISDRKPEDIKNIDDRIRTRFMGGLIADISKPDFAMRMAVLQQKIAEKGVDFPALLVEYLAKTYPDSVRELEGAVQKLSLFIGMKPEGEVMSVPEAAGILGQDAKSKQKQVTPAPGTKGSVKGV